jgi:hemerythrin-like domain-containing protein
LPFNSVLECSSRRVRVDQDDLKLSVKYQLLVYADDVSAHTTKENAEALVVASKEIGLEVNAVRSNYMVMSRDQNAGRSHGIKTDNS